MEKIIYTIAALLLFLSASASPQKSPTKKVNDKSDDEVLAAVVRFATLARKGVVFLSINGRDPSPDFLRRFAVWYVRVLPKSQAVYVPVPNQVGMFKDKKTGELGSYFELEIDKRLNDARVEVSGGWWQPCGTYTVIFQGGVWSVEGYEAWNMCW